MMLSFPLDGKVSPLQTRNTRSEHPSMIQHVQRKFSFITFLHENLRILF